VRDCSFLYVQYLIRALCAHGYITFFKVCG
jgi:hypothetical protein